jgi:deazaflavin-dependent oxidoreductase (nitroreductase family)
VPDLVVVDIRQCQARPCSDLVHHRGRKSGREYVTPTMYLPHDTEPDIIYVFATKGGSPTNPDWYRNLTPQPHPFIWMHC